MGNKTYITLVVFPAAILGFIPFLGPLVQLGLCIWFGMKGNEWAWKNKQLNSVEEFNAYQKKWAIAGVIVLGTLLSILNGAAAVMGGAHQ